LRANKNGGTLGERVLAEVGARDADRWKEHHRTA